MPSCKESISDLTRSIWTDDVKLETKEIIAVAWPLIVASLWSFLLAPVSLMFCGHLGTEILDGVSLAGSIINIAGIAIVTGLSAACDTLFPQTYASGNYRQLGIYLQRSIIIIALSMLPCIGFELNTTAFLKAIGQNAEVSAIAGEYMTLFIFGMPGCFAYVLLSKYLQNQDILYPTIIIGAIGNGVNALLHYLAINVLQFGFEASAIAQAVSFDIMGLMTIGYIMIWKVHKKHGPWPSWGKRSFFGWGNFMKLAIPSLVMICVEAWTIEIGVFVSGLVSVTQQSAQSVLFQVQTMTDMLTIGFGSAASIRIGQHLGRGDYVMAKLSAKLCLVMAFILSALVCILIAALRDVLPLLFANDPEVVEISARLLPIVGLYVLADGIAAVGGGIVRGCGRQLAGSIVNFICYYLIALPVGIPLLLVFGRIDPLWIGLAGALGIAAVMYLLLIWRTDWERQAVLAAERSNLDALVRPPAEDVSTTQSHKAVEAAVHQEKDENDEPVIAEPQTMVEKLLDFSSRRRTWVTQRFSTTSGMRSSAYYQVSRQSQFLSHHATRPTVQYSNYGATDRQAAALGDSMASNVSASSTAHLIPPEPIAKVIVDPDGEYPIVERPSVLADRRSVSSSIPCTPTLILSRIAAFVTMAVILVVCLILRIEVFPQEHPERHNSTTSAYNTTTFTTTPFENNTNFTTTIATTVIMEIFKLTNS